MSTFRDTLLARTAPDGDLFGVVTAVTDPTGTFIDSSGAALVNYSTGRLVFTCAGGRRKWDSSEQPDLDTTYWAYSFTKLLTTIAALQCVERGQIGLDDAVEGILPELKNPQIIGPGDNEAGTQFTLTSAIGKITLRHLLTHTSGVGYDIMNPLLLAWRESRGESTMSMCGDVVKAYSMPLLFEPGESWAYGGSLDWAGQVVERLTGQRLGEYMQKNIFSRLEMKNTTFNVIENPHVKQKVMDMVTRSTDGKLSPIDNMYPEDAKTDSGGMGVLTSVGDYIQVVGDLIKEKPRLLQSGTRDQMFEPQFEAIGKQTDGLMAMGVRVPSPHSQVVLIDEIVYAREPDRRGEITGCLWIWIRRADYAERYTQSASRNAELGWNAKSCVVCKQEERCCSMLRMPSHTPFG